MLCCSIAIQNSAVVFKLSDRAVFRNEDEGCVGDVDVTFRFNSRGTGDIPGALVYGDRTVFCIKADPFSIYDFNDSIDFELKKAVSICLIVKPDTLSTLANLSAVSASLSIKSATIPV